MKFLCKTADSVILKKGLTYKENRPENNKLLKQELLKEQKNFCAYTEKYIQELDSTEVEHFNASLKYYDNYYNYYAVIRRANLYKKDEIYTDSDFFSTKFFQNREQFNARIGYKDGFYYPINESDTDAEDLIDFLGFNHPSLEIQRKRHVRRLKKHFEDAEFTKEQIIEYFCEHKEELSFITAIEDTFQIEMESIL